MLGDSSDSEQDGGDSEGRNGGEHAVLQQAPQDAAKDAVSPMQGQRHLKRAADLLRVVHLTVPNDSATFNRALAIWCALTF